MKLLFLVGRYHLLTVSLDNEEESASSGIFSHKAINPNVSVSRHYSHDLFNLNFLPKGLPGT